MPTRQIVSLRGSKFNVEPYRNHDGSTQVNVHSGAFRDKSVGSFTVIKETAPNKGYRAHHRSPYYGSFDFIRPKQHEAIHDGAVALVQRAFEVAEKVAAGHTLFVAFRNVPGWAINHDKAVDVREIHYSHGGGTSLYLVLDPDSHGVDAVNDYAKRVATDWQKDEADDRRYPAPSEYSLFANIHDALRWLNNGNENKDDLEFIGEYEANRTILGQVLYTTQPDQQAVTAEAQRRAEEIRTKAAELLALLDCDVEGSYVPSSTAHFAVEGAKTALRALTSDRYALTAQQVIQGVR